MSGWIQFGEKGKTYEGKPTSEKVGSQVSVAGDGDGKLNAAELTALRGVSMPSGATHFITSELKGSDGRPKLFPIAKLFGSSKCNALCVAKGFEGQGLWDGALPAAGSGAAPAPAAGGGAGGSGGGGAAAGAAGAGSRAGDSGGGGASSSRPVERTDAPGEAVAAAAVEEEAEPARPPESVHVTFRDSGAQKEGDRKKLITEAFSFTPTAGFDPNNIDGENAARIMKAIEGDHRITGGKYSMADLTAGKEVRVGRSKVFLKRDGKRDVIALAYIKEMADQHQRDTRSPDDDLFGASMRASFDEMIRKAREGTRKWQQLVAVLLSCGAVDFIDIAMAAMEGSTAMVRRLQGLKAYTASQERVMASANRMEQMGRGDPKELSSAKLRAEITKGDAAKDDSSAALELARAAESDAREAWTRTKDDMAKRNAHKERMAQG